MSAGVGSVHSHRNPERRMEITLGELENHDVGTKLLDELEVEGSEVVTSPHRVAEGLVEKIRSQHVVGKGIAEDEQTRAVPQVGSDLREAPWPSRPSCRRGGRELVPGTSWLQSIDGIVEIAVEGQKIRQIGSRMLLHAHRIVFDGFGNNSGEFFADALHQQLVGDERPALRPVTVAFEINLSVVALRRQQRRFWIDEVEGRTL